MKKALIILCMSLFVFGCCPSKQCESKTQRKVGVAMYTFHKRTLEDCIPLLKDMDIDAIGLSTTPLSAKFPKVKTGPEMNDEQKAFLKKLLADNGMKIVSFGVRTPKDEKGVKAICDFAKEFDIPLILTEAVGDMLPLWEKYCQQYNLKMALHNHASDNTKHNSYYNPNITKAAIGNFKNIYACPDNGHYARSGVQSVAAYKILEGKIAMLHFKDVNKFDDLKAHAVPLGTGALNMQELLAELDRQKFDGYYMIEYEFKPEDNVADVKACVEFLRKN